MAAKKYRTVMLIDDNEIDNLINQKMIEAASVTDNIYTHKIVLPIRVIIWCLKIRSTVVIPK